MERRNPQDEPGQHGHDELDELRLAPAAILEGLPDAVVAASRDGRIVFVNALAEELFGYAREELLGQRVQMLWAERVRERYVRNMQLYFATDHPLRFTSEAWGRRRDGSEFVGEMSWGIVETTAGPLLLAIGRDISECRAAEARLRAVAALGERALAGADLADLAAEAVTLLRRMLPIAGAQVWLASGGALASDGATIEPVVRVAIGNADELRVVPQHELTDEEMNLVRAVANTLATALARLHDEARVRYDAVHDPLTGLANRTLLTDRLAHALARSEREGRPIGVLFVDLDGFKHVNDAYGHAIGDAVLGELGRRLRAAVRPADTVARVGGDEFVVLCEDIDQAAAVTLGKRLLEAIHAPLMLHETTHEVSASIGIALGRHHPESLLRDADVAVYRAKAQGRGRVVFFE